MRFHVCRQCFGGGRVQIVDPERLLGPLRQLPVIRRGWTALPSFKGDRILVMMFPYDLPFLPGSRPPERWDVVVFRYPEEPEVSYIKRLVGLPGETIRISHGDIYVKPADGE